MYLATKKNLLDDGYKLSLACPVSFPRKLADCRILRPLSHELQRITKAPTGQEVEVTSKERTLIDIAIRPAYSGGVAQILKPTNELAAKPRCRRCSNCWGRSIRHTYHQAVGFSWFLEHQFFVGELAQRVTVRL